MNEAKVYTCFCQKVEKTKAVTHADYRALEEQSAYFRKEWNKAEGKIASLEEELASIKARVGGIEKKDPDLCNREYANGWNACRLALEAPK